MRTFEELFALAIAQWPDVVEVQDLRATGRADVFVVAGLGTIGDSVSSKCRGLPNEILMVNLHEAICATIRAQAVFCNRVTLAVLRMDAVRREFEDRLLLTIATPDLGWTDDDLLLAKSFLGDSKA